MGQGVTYGTRGHVTVMTAQRGCLQAEVGLLSYGLMLPIVPPSVSALYQHAHATDAHALRHAGVTTTPELA